MGININLGGNIQNLIVNNSPAQRIVVDGTEVWPGSTDSELDFTLTSNLTQPLYLTQSAANAVTVDWGDGSSTESPSNLSASLSHTYAEAGDYTIRIACADGETWSPGAAITSGSKTTNYGLCGQGGKKGTYPTLTGVRFGNRMRLDVQYSFFGCTSLTSMTIPDSVISIGSGAFQNCSNLMSVMIPDSVTSIGSSAFYGCSKLTSMTIPVAVQFDPSERNYIHWGGHYWHGQCGSAFTSEFCNQRTIKLIYWRANWLVIYRYDECRY